MRQYFPLCLFAILRRIASLLEQLSNLLLQVWRSATFPHRPRYVRAVDYGLKFQTLLLSHWKRLKCYLKVQLPHWHGPGRPFSHATSTAKNPPFLWFKKNVLDPAGWYVLREDNRYSETWTCLNFLVFKCCGKHTDSRGLKSLSWPNWWQILRHCSDKDKAIFKLLYRKDFQSQWCLEMFTLQPEIILFNHVNHHSYNQMDCFLTSS